MKDNLNHPEKSFEYVRSKKKVSVPVGGIEQNIAFFLTSQHGNYSKALCGDLSDEEYEDRLYAFWSILQACLSATCDVYCRLFAPNHLELIDQIFLPSGDVIKFEDFAERALIAEVCTVEFSDSSHLCVALRDIKEKIRESIAEDPQSKALCVATHPGFLPRFGRRNHFNLGFHINISRNDSPYLVDVAEIESALSCLMPFISSGGIGPEGFCISPQSSEPAVRSNLADRHNAALPYRVTVKKNVRIGRNITEEERFHIPVDPPYSLEGAAMVFSTAQLLVVMSCLGHPPLNGLKLKNPVRTRARWSENFDCKCALRTKKRVGARDLLLALRSQILRFLERYSLPESLEETAEKLLKGSLLVASQGNELDEYLINKFEYFTKRYLYERLLRDYFGVSLQRFSTLTSILYRLGIPANEIISLSPKSLKRMVASLSLHRFDLISTMMHENRVDYADLITGAHIHKKIEAIELSLGRIYPPQNEFLETLEDKYVELTRKKYSGKRELTRADARRRIIQYLKTAWASGSFDNLCESDRVAFYMDWCNFFALSVGDGFIMLYVQPMGEPSSQLLEPPFRLVLTPETVSQISYSIPGGDLFVKLISKAVNTYMLIEESDKSSVEQFQYSNEDDDGEPAGEDETTSYYNQSLENDGQTEEETNKSLPPEEKAQEPDFIENLKLFD